MNTSLANPLTTFSTIPIGVNHIDDRTKIITSVISAFSGFLSFRSLKAFRVCRSLDQVIMHKTSFHNYLLSNMLKLPFNHPEDTLIFIEKRGSSIKIISLKSEKLSLTDNQLQMIMEKCPHLINLQIANQEHITDEGIKNLALLTKLIHLEIMNCKQLKSEGIEYLRPLKNLKSLALVAHPITDYEMNRLTQSLNQLESFSLTECNEITNRGLSYLNILNLTSLHLTRLDKISDTGIKNIKNSNNLKSFSLVNCKQITNEGLKWIVNFKKLIFLDLTESQIIDQTVECLIGLDNLQTFILKNCNGITKQTLDFLNKFKTLTSLKIEGTKIKEIGGYLRKFDAIA